MNLRPPGVSKRAAMIALCAVTPNGTGATPQKKPGLPSHGVNGNVPGNPEIVNTPLPAGKNWLTKTTLIMPPETKKSDPGVNTEKPGGKKPKGPKPCTGQPNPP